VHTVVVDIIILCLLEATIQALLFQMLRWEDGLTLY